MAGRANATVATIDFHVLFIGEVEFGSVYFRSVGKISDFPKEYVNLIL